MAEKTRTTEEGVLRFKLPEKLEHPTTEAGESWAFNIHRQWRMKRTEIDGGMDAPSPGGESGGGGDDGR